MATEEESGPKWVEIQKKTFTRWANTYLKERMMKVNDLKTDLSDGLLLINLLEIISSKEIKTYNKKPKLRPQKLENNDFALQFLKKEGIKLVNIGATDITDCKLKLILGLVWTVILRYQIQIEEGRSARSDLLKWVQQQIPEYGITGFSKDWNDGKAIVALANSLEPGIYPNHMQLDASNALDNARLGGDLAEKHFEIPKVLAPEDMINPEVDELSVMTYISYFRDYLQNASKRKEAELLERTPVASKCKVYGPGIEKAEALIPTEFTIEAINTFGRRVPIGGHAFVVQVTQLDGGKAEIASSVEDQQNGLYVAKYTPTEAGKLQVAVTLKDQAVAQSPYTVPVSKATVDASKCRAYGPGLEPGVVIGQEAPFTVELYNRLGTVIPNGGQNVQVKVVGPYNNAVPATIADTPSNGGKYPASYRPTDLGEHTIHVNVAGQPIANSPFKVGVVGGKDDADAMNCRAYGPGVDGGATTAEPAVFTVELFNNKNERIKTGGAPISVDVQHPNGQLIDANITDNKDGTFTVSYEPEDAGTYVVDVMLHNRFNQIYYDHIKNSPFSVKIEPGTDANNSIAFGPGLEDGVKDNEPTHFTIQARDTKGRDLKKGGDPFDVSIDGPNGPIKAKVSDNGDGTYKVEYAPSDAGKHTVKVNLKGSPIKNMPVTVNVKHGADAGYTVIESFSFVVQVKNKHNANKTEGGDDVQVKINGPNNTEPKATVADQNNGQYIVTYSLPSAGKYTVHITVDGKPIKGSPLTQQF